MRNSHRLFFSVLPFMLLAACATKYQSPSPESSQTARIRVLSTIPIISWAYRLQNSCTPSNGFGWESNELISTLIQSDRISNKTIGMPIVGIPDNAKFVETRVPTGIPFNLGFYLGSTIVSPYSVYSNACGVGIQFLPEQGADYQFAFSSDGNQCVVSAHKIIQKNDVSPTLQQMNDVVKLPKC